MTLNSSKDAESRKEMPFWGYKVKKMKSNRYLPKNPNNLAVYRQFLAKMVKRETPSISEINVKKL